MSEYIFRDAPGFGCDMSGYMDDGRTAIGEFYAKHNTDHYGTIHEEVVRCRDCRHATISTTGVCKYCEMFVLPDTDGYGADAQVNLPLDFFCAWGERK